MYVCIYMYGLITSPQLIGCLSLPVPRRCVSSYDPGAAVVAACFADCYVGRGVPHALGWIMLVLSLLVTCNASVEARWAG
jgi:hypothetical protein